MQYNRGMKRVLFTKQGYEELKKEHEELGSKRKVAVKTLTRAREMGDLSENGLYKAARFELSSIDHRLRQTDRLLKQAKIAQSTQSGTVQIGYLVTISDGKKEQEYHIVGEYESNPLEGKLSHVSPIGKALMGKKKSEKIQITLPKGVFTYTIVKIQEQ